MYINANILSSFSKRSDLHKALASPVYLFVMIALVLRYKSPCQSTSVLTKVHQAHSASLDTLVGNPTVCSEKLGGFSLLGCYGGGASILQIETVDEVVFLFFLIG